MNLRQRTSNQPLELKENRRLTFYAAIFDSPTIIYEKGKTFKELVRPGAFQNSLKGNDEIVANIDHLDDKTFARRSTGELLLQEDKKGLFATCWLPETELGDMIVRDVQREFLTGSSFRSRIVPDGDRWLDDLCEVVFAPLVDVCITHNPAYPQTEVKLRTAKYKELFRRLRLLKIKL